MPADRLGDDEMARSLHALIAAGTLPAPDRTLHFNVECRNFLEAWLT